MEEFSSNITLDSQQNNSQLENYFLFPENVAIYLLIIMTIRIQCKYYNKSSSHYDLCMLMLT